ncbi:hypothetical protein DV451_000431 [Geotrichum candidum]|uniref:Uncharacterized protein n=1 Tax=Geotrichum candidum TaxID=1173061 RepID=A0A9P5GBZ2_GEOCN|nr:hypothetical protein DV451_000431 [Geotrichum candidum]KAF5106867.1 hypothetical protein DV453_003591 [Geotrichum candidum]
MTVYQASNAIQDLQQRYGVIGRITGKGVQAQQLTDILLRKREEHQTTLSEIGNDATPKEQFDQQYTNVFTGTVIDQLIVIDRQVDPLTPLLTQLTYEGLIDEFYGVSESGQADLPTSVVTPPSQQQQQQQQQHQQHQQRQLNQHVHDPDHTQHAVTADSRKKLNLISDQQEDLDPSDIAFTYSGYAPLSVRLVQCVIDKSSVLGPKYKKRAAVGPVTGAAAAASTGGWKGAEEILKYIPGPRVDELQHSESFIREDKLRKILVKNSGKRNAAGKNGGGAAIGNKHTVLVLFVGGITYAEISALRFVAKRSEHLYNLVIATTGIISGDKVIDACLEV